MECIHSNFDVMELRSFYLRLKEAYSDKNLNKLTGKLIELYQKKNFGKIREITKSISKYITIDEEQDSRCFSRLVMLYHPDRGESIRETLDKLFLAEDRQGLNTYAHILCLENLEHITVTVELDTDIDYTPEYRWDDIERNSFSFFDPNAEESEFYEESEEIEKSFYNAVKLRIYGDLEMDFPLYYLEDFEEIELSGCSIEYLDGVEYCKHAVIMDLSDNAITDINALWNLRSIEELYLSDNQLAIIDVLSNLQNLRIVDLSSNQLDDISPILSLDKLEFVNIIGNKVSVSQVEELRKRGVVVMYEPIQ